MLLASSSTLTGVAGSAALLFCMALTAPAPTATAQVIIGGAGYAGVSAAKILTDYGVDVILLEATDHLGGRMFAKPFGTNPETGESYMMETGANWIQGLEGNPVWDDAVKYGLGGSSQNWDDLVIYDQNGEFNQLETDYDDGSLCLKADDAFVGAAYLSEKCIQPTASSSHSSSSDDVGNDERRGRKRKLKGAKKAGKNDGSSKKKDKQQEEETDEELCRVLLQKKGFRFKDDDDLSNSEAEKLVNGFDPPEEENEAIARLCQYFSQDAEFGESPDITSVNNTLPSTTYNWFEDANYWVNDNRGGYGWIVQSIAAEFMITSVNTGESKVFDDERLMLNTKVLKVVYDPDDDASDSSKVAITVCDTIKQSSNNNPDSWICQVGSEREIYGDHFISTFSMGVLGETIRQEGTPPSAASSQELGFAPVFDPPLSSNEALKESISTYPMAYYSKLFFQFPEKFWGDSEMILSAAIGTSKSGRSWIGDFAPVWQSLDVTEEGFLPGSNILFLSVTGDRAFELQTDYTDDEIIAEMLPVLNLIFADNIALTAADVLDFSMTRWITDPLTRGMYTNRRVGVSWEDTEPSRARYGNLMFTGEHACLAFNGYTHGAKLAGERTARILLRERYDMPEADNVQSICDVSPSEEDRRHLEAGRSKNPSGHLRHSRGYPVENRLTNEDIDAKFESVGTARRSLNGK